MNKNPEQSSHKASEARTDCLSNQAGLQSSSDVRPLTEVIKLGVDTHAGQYTFAHMVDQLGIQPAQALSPIAFLEFLKRQMQQRRQTHTARIGHKKTETSELPSDHDLGGAGETTSGPKSFPLPLPNPPHPFLFPLIPSMEKQNQRPLDNQHSRGRESLKRFSTP